MVKSSAGSALLTEQDGRLAGVLAALVHVEQEPRVAERAEVVAEDVDAARAAGRGRRICDPGSRARYGETAGQCETVGECQKLLLEVQDSSRSAAIPLRDMPRVFVPVAGLRLRRYRPGSY